MISVLCTGDVHIGRTPTRLRDGDHREPLSAGSVWTRIVDLAVRRRVDLVAVSGDLLDRDSASIEAFGVVRQGLFRLAEAEIAMVAISGNHDHDSFPRLAKEFEGEHFRFLGRNGKWEEARYRFRGDEELSVIGWSYPGPVVTSSPLAGAGEFIPASGPRLGLLHADVGVTTGSYCPVTEQELAGSPVTCWLLGHIHGSRWFDSNGRKFAVYPGSPVALDPGESGDHGVHLLRFDAAGLLDDEFIAISPVRYDTLTIQLNPDWNRDEVASTIQRESHERCEHLAGSRSDDGELHAIMLRVDLTGRTGQLAGLPSLAAALEGEFRFERNGCIGRIERIRSFCQSTIEIDRLVLVPGPVGELAKIVRAFRDRD